MKQLKVDSYKEYVKLQTKGNKAKLKKNKNLHGIKNEEIDFVTKYVKKNIPEATFGICHGVRNGWEVCELRKSLDIDIIGTDISSTAVEFEHVIQHDFHKIKPEWLGSVDFIMTNSLDHSYDPAMAIDQWMSCVKDTGRLFLIWMKTHNESFLREGSGDLFGANRPEYKDLIEKKYCLEEMKPIRVLNHGVRYIFIVKHRRESNGNGIEVS